MKARRSNLTVTALVLAALAGAGDAGRALDPATAASAASASDQHPKSLVLIASATVEFVFSAKGTYTAATARYLSSQEPNITFKATGRALALRDQVRVSGVSASGYTLRSEGASGRTFILQRRANGSIMRTCRIASRSCGTW